MISKELKYLEDLQGVILLLLHETGTRTSIQKLNSLDKTTYEDIVRRMRHTEDKILMEIVNPSSKNMYAKRKKELESKNGKKLAKEIIDRYWKADRIAEYEKLRNNPPITKFQSIHSYRIISSLLERIDKVISDNPKYQLSKEIVYGTTTTFNLNAVAISLDKDANPIIILESEVFMICHYLSKVVALSVPFDENGPVYLEQPIKEEYTAFNFDMTAGEVDVDDDNGDEMSKTQVDAVVLLLEAFGSDCEKK